jgi:drug/metabolite transporter (DMT)-like permease
MNTRERRGLWFGLAGVAIFALTLPMTRLAVGTPEAPLMSGVFVALGRAALAGLLSVLFLLAGRAPLPRRSEWAPLAVTAAGVVFGFPLCSSIAMRHVEAVHASVIVGVLPLATAVVGAWLHRQRFARGFWFCAALGSGLVVLFALLRSGTAVRLHSADALLLAAMALGAVGYAWGARLSQRMPAEHVICWALCSRCRFHAAAGLVDAPAGAAAGQRLVGLRLCLRVLDVDRLLRLVPAGSPWAAPCASARCSWLQPFLSMVFAVPLLGERLDALSAAFALAVIATVFAGRRMAVPAAPVLTPALESR